jgi:CBS domain containing-hemolysin-like protein
MTALVVLASSAVLLVVTASAIEVAFFSVPAERIQELESSEMRRARSLVSLRARPAALLSLLWSVRVLGAALAVMAAWRAMDIISVTSTALIALAVAAAIMVMVLAEFAGKTLGQRAGERFCLDAATPAWLLSRLLWVVTWPAELISRLLAPKFIEIRP